MATVLAACTKSFLAFAERRGLSRAELLASAQLTDEAFADPNARIDESHDVALWRAVVAALDDEALGLGYAIHRANDTLSGIVGLVANAMPTVDEALRAAATYHRLLRDEGSATYRIESEVGVLEWCVTGASWLPEMEDAVLGACVVFARAWTGSDVLPVRVRMQRAAPRDRRPYDDLFGCPIEFGRGSGQMHFSRDARALALRRRHGEVAPYLRLAADRYIERLSATRTLCEQLTVAFVEAGTTDQEAIARYFGWSPRTLQRRLVEERLTYQTIVDEYRLSLALRLMKDSTLSVLQIAHQSGFSDARAFRRALRRWRTRSSAPPGPRASEET